MQALKDIACATVEGDGVEKQLYELYKTTLKNIKLEDVSKRASDRGKNNVGLYTMIEMSKDLTSKDNHAKILEDVDRLIEEERLLQNIQDTVTRCNGDDHQTFAARTGLQGTLFEGLDRHFINHPDLIAHSCLPQWKWAGRKLWAQNAQGRSYGKVGTGTEKVQRDNVIGVIAGYDHECANYICDEIERLAAQTQETYDGQKQKRHVYFVFNTQGGDVAALQQILVCMDRYRDRLLYVGIIAAPECAAAMAASCGGCHFAACDICILEALSQFLMHEVHTVGKFALQRESSNMNGTDAIQESMGILTDELYDAAEISVLIRLMDKPDDQKVVSELLRGNSLIALELTLWLRHLYYMKYSVEILHHARQHGNAPEVMEFLQCSKAMAGRVDGGPPSFKRAIAGADGAATEGAATEGAISCILKSYKSPSHVYYHTLSSGIP